MLIELLGRGMGKVKVGYTDFGEAKYKVLRLWGHHTKVQKRGT